MKPTVRRTLTLLAAATALALPAASAAAADPPDSWTNLRVLDCDGEQVTTYLTPAGFGTPFHIVGTTDVIVPKHVEVTTGGQTLVTLHVPGFDQSRSDAVHCSYVDPVGLAVSFVGLRG